MTKGVEDGMGECKDCGKPIELGLGMFGKKWYHVSNSDFKKCQRQDYPLPNRKPKGLTPSAPVESPEQPSMSTGDAAALHETIATMKEQLAAMTKDRDLWQEAHDEDCPNKAMVDSLRAELARERERHQELRSIFTFNEIDEISCDWGPPEYVMTDDGEAWYWRFAGHDLPVADNLSELLNAAQQLAKKRAPAPVATGEGK